MRLDAYIHGKSRDKRENKTLQKLEKRVEVMAPAGSWEALTGALQGGADSVFFGVGKLNMRSGSAGNFTVGDMRGVAEEAHGGGARCYLTVNTVVYEEELAEAQRLVEAAAGAGVDAIIASDQAVVEMAYGAGLPVQACRTLERCVSTPVGPTWWCWPASSRCRAFGPCGRR